MDQKKYKNSSPRIKVIQKIYGSLLNPDEEIIYSKSQYKKYIKDVVSGTLERVDLIEETITKHLDQDINLKRTDKLLKIILSNLSVFFKFISVSRLLITVSSINSILSNVPETTSLIYFLYWLFE